MDMTREDMIDEMMEGVAFEEDNVIRACLDRYSLMSYNEVLKEYKEWIGE
jgi:hypothetical protein